MLRRKGRTVLDGEVPFSITITCKKTPNTCSPGKYICVGRLGGDEQQERDQLNLAQSDSQFLSTNTDPTQQEFAICCVWGFSIGT